MTKILDKEYDRFDREAIIHQFMNDPVLPEKIMLQDPVAAVDSPLISFYSRGGSKSAVIG